MAGILGDAANIIIAESVFLSDTVKVIVVGVPDVDTFACAHPDEPS